ncbi:hypothetical protein [Paenibacillus polymyxa]|uniref:hypothetical protein n=1 Tax=Paenibacillus polymyxa TaxID=1406 RepID=UPI0007EB1832|nr:hypothetical protein [Paenibacillus polymyxa]OAZ49750.1 hypothetical protein A9Z39_10610 [Paenibacillus polymyxa]
MKPNKEKIDFLNANTHHLVTDYEADGETCGEVMVRLTPSVEDTLKAVGIDETWIALNRVELNDGGHGIDLTYAGFRKCGAVWWHPDHGFMTHRYE